MEKKSSPLLSIIMFEYYFNWFMWYFSFSFAFNTFSFWILTSLIWFRWFYFLCKRRNCFGKNHLNSAIKCPWFSYWKYMVGFQIYLTRFTVSVYKSKKKKWILFPMRVIKSESTNNWYLIFRFYDINPLLFILTNDIERFLLFGAIFPAHRTIYVFISVYLLCSIPWYF